MMPSAWAGLPIGGLLAALSTLLAGSLGIPLPTFAVLIYAGSLLAVAPEGAAAAAALTLVGTLCVLGGDIVWFAIGRRFGARILALVCRLSISRDTCVRNTADLFARRGLNVLLVSRFLPGLSLVTAPLAGASGVPVRQFTLYDGAGIVLWIAVGLALGFGLASEITMGLLMMRHLGLDLGGAALLLTLGYIAYRWVWRRMLIRQLRMARISVDALNDLIAAGTAPVIIDVRSPLQQAEDPFLIPGALVVQLDQLEQVLHHVSPTHPTVVYCACPNEVSAAMMTRRLRRRGLTNIRPLAGGIDAWRAAGFPVDPVLTLAAETAVAA